MKPIAVLYASGDGPTRVIAEHLGAKLLARSYPVVLEDIRTLPGDFSLCAYEGAILVTGVLGLRPQREVVAVAKQHHVALEHMPAALVSVGVWHHTEEDDVTANREDRIRAAAVVEEHLARFFEASGWRAPEVKALGGIIFHTRDAAPTRVVMKLIDPKTGRATDANGDHVYTDLEALEHLVDSFAEELPSPTSELHAAAQ